MDEEHRRELGLILPEKLTDSLQDYLLNDFREANQYEYLKDQFEEIHDIGSGKWLKIEHIKDLPLPEKPSTNTNLFLKVRFFLDRKVFCFM